MKTQNHTFGKSIVLFVIAAFTVTSCIYYEEPYPKHGTEGKAYVRLNWNKREPDYVETDDIVPSNFSWNTYYRAVPGFYTVRYEYDYNNGYRIITDAYEADVEVWINHADLHSYSGNAADSYFDMELYPDGGYDFTVNSRQKSAMVIDSLKQKPLGTIDSITTVQNGLTMKIVYKRVEPRAIRLTK